MKIKAFLSSLLLLAVFAAKAQDTVFPEPVGLVSDFEDILPNVQQAQLEALLNAFMQTGTGVIAIATVHDIGDYDDFDQYAIDLSNHWGAGNKNKNNGLTIVVSSNLRKVRINTGTGTMAIITDDFCDDVVQNNMLPHFREAEYFEGVYEAVQAIITQWQNP